MPTPFKALLASIHRDAVRCALADFDADRDGREPDQREAAFDLARECAVSLCDARWPGAAHPRRRAERSRQTRSNGVR